MPKFPIQPTLQLSYVDVLIRRRAFTGVAGLWRGATVLVARGSLLASGQVVKDSLESVCSLRRFCRDESLHFGNADAGL